MKLRALIGFGLLLASTMGATLGCSRNAIEAINLANEADKQKDVDVDGAISKYEQASQLDPTNHRILFKLAMAYRKKEAWDKVASSLARATQVAPKFANYWYNKGFAIEEQAAKKTISWEEAKEPFKKCIEADPNYADCYHELGYTYLWTDNEQEALANYTKAIERKPDELRYYTRLADLYLALGYYDQAQQVLKEALAYGKEGDKFLFGVHVLLSQVYQTKNQMNEMVTELEAAAKSLATSTRRFSTTWEHVRGAQSAPQDGGDSDPQELLGPRVPRCRRDGRSTRISAKHRNRSWPSSVAPCSREFHDRRESDALSGGISEGLRSEGIHGFAGADKLFRTQQGLAGPRRRTRKRP